MTPKWTASAGSFATRSSVSPPLPEHREHQTEPKDMTMNNQCSCGGGEPHIIARRTTADGIGVEFWHDGAITGRTGLALPGVPIVRPRTADATDLALRSASLVSGDVELYDLSDLPRLYMCARRAAARFGSPGDMRAEFAKADVPKIRIVWSVYSTDRAGDPTVRFARLDRIRWPGIVLWHERGYYEVAIERMGIATGARSRLACESTGVRFRTQRELSEYLASVARPLTGYPDDN